MKPVLLLLAFAALPLSAQSTLEAQQDRLARQMAAQQQQQAVLTRQLNAENDRLQRNAAQQRVDALAAQAQSAIAYGHPAGDLALLEQQRAVEQTLLSSIDQRQNLAEQQLQVEIERLRTNLSRANAAGLLSPYAIERRQLVIAQHEAELQRMRDERRENAASRTLTEAGQAAQLQQARRTQDARDTVAAARQQGLNSISEQESRELRKKAARKH